MRIGAIQTNGNVSWGKIGRRTNENTPKTMARPSDVSEIEMEICRLSILLCRIRNKRKEVDSTAGTTVEKSIDA
jgi:hypothetical protein